jgi:hypothetical protein
MPFVVTGTALLKCSFGAAPMPLTVLPKAQAQVLLPVAGIFDSNPIANVPPLAMCSSPANPAVAAALGAPMPCVPVTMPWLPGHPTVIVSGAPLVTSDCKMMCGYGGVIQVMLPGQMNVKT